MTPSSEEIAAALEVANLRLAASAAEERGYAGETEWAAKWDHAAAVLTAHLSRLREEARFRDAAMAYCARYLWHDPKEHPLGGDVTGPFQAAYYELTKARALEEPRDG